MDIIVKPYISNSYLLNILVYKSTLAGVIILMHHTTKPESNPYKEDVQYYFIMQYMKHWAIDHILSRSYKAVIEQVTGTSTVHFEVWVLFLDVKPFWNSVVTCPRMLWVWQHFFFLLRSERLNAPQSMTLLLAVVAQQERMTLVASYSDAFKKQYIVFIILWIKKNENIPIKLRIKDYIVYHLGNKTFWISLCRSHKSNPPLCKMLLCLCLKSYKGCSFEVLWPA